MKTRLLASCCALGLASSLGAQSVFTDNFADANRTGWFSSAGPSTLTVTDGAMRQDTGGSGRSVVTYISAGTVVLAVGESLTASFDLRLVGPAGTLFADANGANNQLRFGLFYSGGGTRVISDNFGSASYPGGAAYNFASQDGYASLTTLHEQGKNSDGSQASTSIRDRTGSNTALISTTTGYTTLGSSIVPPVTFQIDTTYTGSMTITRTASGVDISVAYTGGAFGTNYAFSRSDTTDAVFQFDMLAFHVNSNVATAFTLDNVAVSVIPEPSTYAALAGLLALGFVAWRRRQTA